MNSENKWIKLHSKLLNWEWYKDSNTMRLFIHCLLKANWKNGKFQGEDVPRGSFVTGRKQLAEELGISEQSIRTSISKLKSTSEITIKSTNKFSIITVVNYEKYQENNQVTNQQLTNNQPATNQQLTTIEEYKNIDDIDNSTTTNTRESIFDVLQKEFGRLLSPMEYEIVLGWLDLGIDEELIKHAIKESVANEAKSLRYTQRILESYKRKNIKTVSEAQKAEKEFKERREKSGETTKTKKNNWEEEFLNEM